MNFGIRLKVLRADRCLTQNQLGDLLHISRATIAGYETKNKQPDYEKLCAIADFFDVSIDYLVGRTDTPTLNPVSPNMPVQESTLPINSTDPDLQHLVDIYKQLSNRRQATLLERGEILMEDQVEEEFHSTKKNA